MTFLLLAPMAFAHSTAFGPTKLRALPENPDELWAVAEGWGVLHSSDGGAGWVWLCEESLATTTVYDVLPWADNEALVATATGVLHVGADCSTRALEGLPAGFVLVMERWGTRAVVGWIGDGVGGLYTCDGDSCAATDVVGDYYFPKSLYADGEVLWTTIIHTDTLDAQLLRLDTESTSLIQDFPEGDTDPRVVFAEGDNVHLWVRPRTAAWTPEYRRSTDRGASFVSTFSTGYYTDPAPGVVVRDAGKEILVGSYYGARTWRSTDSGASFTEVSETVPAVKCGVALGERTLICADHLADGFDIAVSTDGTDFSPLACFEEVRPAACAAETCDDALVAWESAGAYGGGQCDAEADSANDDDPEPECECGGASIIFALPLPVFLRRRYWPKTT